MDKAALGKRIQEFRRQADFTAEVLAERCNCSVGTIRKIESGERLPSLPLLLDLCNSLEVSPNELIGAELTYEANRALGNGKDEMQNAQLLDIILRLQRLPREKCHDACIAIEALLRGMESP